MPAALLGVALFASAARADEALEHLRAGGSAFREGRFDRALVEFRVAEQQGAGGEAAWYVGAALLKLGRADEAVERFDAAERAAPGGRDVVLDFYRASACYEARLYLTADRLLAGIGERAGPRLAAEAQRLRDRIAALFTAPPAESVIDWYQAQAALEHRNGRLALARAYYLEAAALSERRPSAYRAADAAAGLQAVSATLGATP
jgi:tetratricopeptide (TPR) repeat protein